MKNTTYLLIVLGLLFSCANIEQENKPIVTDTVKVDLIHLEYKLRRMNDKRDIQIKERNLALISIFQDSIHYEGKLLQEDSLYHRIRAFIKSDSNNPKLPEYKQVVLPIVGIETVSKHMIVIFLDSSTTATRYFAIRKYILDAYNSLRDDYSREKFWIPYADMILSQDVDYSAQLFIIERKYPIRISESIRK